MSRRKLSSTIWPGSGHCGSRERPPSRQARLWQRRRAANHRRNRGKKLQHWLIGWQVNKAAGAEPKPALRWRGPFDHRPRLGRGVVDLHLEHLELILQGHTRLFGGFDRIVVRLEVTVHHQRVATGRG